MIATACVLSLGANARFDDPPRFDGAGYAVLARSILEGRGYREIDHPDAPRHAHFPPGYPLALAALWRITGPSNAAAHALAFLCSLGATLLAWLWFRTWTRPRVALAMGLALAINWRWGRDGTAIGSEPLFLLLGQAAVLSARRLGSGSRGAVRLGLLLGAAILTRHVGLALAAAIVASLVARGRRREAVVALLVASGVIAPWIAWLARVGRHTQVGLVPVGGMPATIAGNSLFYGRRLIDQILGPVVEIATIYRPRYAAIATAFAVVASLVMIVGWCRFIAGPARRRLAGLVPLCTLAMLLAWPFTEAGRFLVPLIPFLVAGLTEGLAWKGRYRALAACAVLLASVPYSAYAIVTGRSEAQRATHRDFDAACLWIAGQAGPAGVVMTRHPGEVFLRTGRLAIEPSGDLDDLIRRRGVAFLLVDDARYANAPPSLLGRFAAEHPARVDLAFASGSGRPVLVYRVRQ